MATEGNYDENDLSNTITIDGVKYIKEKGTNDPLEDPILYTHIPADRAILVNNMIYDVNTIYRYLKSKTEKKGLYRQPISSAKLKEITKKYHIINKINPHNISDLSRQEIMEEIRICLTRQFELRNGLNYHPQTRRGIELIANDQRKIKELDQRVDQLMDEHPWLKSSHVMRDILKNESRELQSSLSRWIDRLGNF